MSVLIKGMKMPHDCFECPLSIPPVSDDSPFWMCGGNAMSIHEANTEEHRPYGCPLVEVEDEDKCEFCYVAQNYNLEDDDSPCQNCGE